MEQHFQDAAQELQHDKSSDTFAAHFAQHLGRKSTLQQCREIKKLNILSKVNPIGLMKTWIKSSCTFFTPGTPLRATRATHKSSRIHIPRLVPAHPNVSIGIEIKTYIYFHRELT